MRRMDVTCEHCGSEYDFDEALLGDKGTTVKCSACGHVFRVVPQTAGRASLRVRFSRTGRVEPLASLRELQRRVRAGEIGRDDELGREGFPFRRLADVPELRNFFAAAPGHSSTLRPPPHTNGHSPPRAGAMATSHDDKRSPPNRAKRTVLGMGPHVHDLPGGSRAPEETMPSAQGGASPSLGSGRPPPRAASHGATRQGNATILGRAPISSVPTAPSAAPASEPPRNHAPISSAPTAPGAQPTPNASDVDTDAATLAANFRPIDGGAGGSAAPAPSLRVSAGPRMGAAVSAPPSAPLSGSAKGSGRSLPSPTAAQPVRLYLSDDDTPPERATQGSSKILLYATAMLVLGGLGWYGVNALSSNLREANHETQPASPEGSQPAPPGLEPSQPQALEPAAALAGSQPAAEAVSQPPGAPPRGEQPATRPTPERQAPRSASARTPASGEAEKKNARAQEQPANRAATKGEAKRSEQGAERRGASAPPEPSDYSGWVMRGDQLFSRSDLQGARAAFEEAVALRGTGSEANSGLGLVLLAQGRPNDALPYLRRAAGNGFAEASIGLGDAYRKLGRKEDAIEAYETYLARLPQGSRAAYAKKQLEALGAGADDESSGQGSQGSDEEPPPSPSTHEEYRPAGELTEPPPEDPGDEAAPEEELSP